MLTLARHCLCASWCSTLKEDANAQVLAYTSIQAHGHGQCVEGGREGGVQRNREGNARETARKQNFHERVLSVSFFFSRCAPPLLLSPRPDLKNGEGHGELLRMRHTRTHTHTHTSSHERSPGSVKRGSFDEDPQQRRCSGSASQRLGGDVCDVLEKRLPLPCPGPLRSRLSCHGRRLVLVYVCGVPAWLTCCTRGGDLFSSGPVGVSLPYGPTLVPVEQRSSCCAGTERGRGMG
uniref:Uncharacterized protein n=1 Tax=Leishmania guyanensis TaxID=5670 RepID=A0A1E1J0N2_LEIGU|nr:Hypothetical protein BN36_2845660 [Leishmania guyanensis]